MNKKLTQSTKITLLLWLLPCVLIAAPLSSDDVKWLNRITYGIDNATIAAYSADGRVGYLNKQLDPKVNDNLPPRIAELVGALHISQEPIKLRVQSMQQENQRINKLPKEEQEQARKATNQAVGQTLQEAMQRHLLRAIYSPAQLKEQLVWFWFNHFNVSRDKNAIVKVIIADYEEHAIRPNVLGKFRDLVMATLHHPAMLAYLDNVQNAAGKINENYARELLELHTLGINGGYSQQDVQALAHILTGVGMNWTENYPKLNEKLAPYYQRDGGFEFNPNRHDFSEQVFLGKKISGDGLSELAQVVDMLVKHPATARFICHKLAVYFVADEPPADLLARMVKTFQSTDGDIAAILHTLFEAKEFSASLGKKVKDPLHYAISALRFAYEDRALSEMQPVINWINEMGEPLYGHATPDGYGLSEKDWLSPEQLNRRFDIAKRIASGKTKLTGLDVDPKTLQAPVLENKLYYLAIEPLLSPQTKTALSKAVSKPEWNTFLLSSPEFMYH